MNPDLTTLIAAHRAKLLAELAICEAATVGPWIVTTAETECGRDCTPNGCCGHDSGVAERIEGPRLDLTCEGDVFDKLDTESGFSSHQWNADLGFIAIARTALPDRIRESLGMLDALEASIWREVSSARLLRMAAGLSDEVDIELCPSVIALRDILTPP